MDGITIGLIIVAFMSWLVVPDSLPPPTQLSLTQPQIIIPQPQSHPLPPPTKPTLKEIFILLPDAEGKKSGIVIKTSDQEVAVTEPLHGVELTGGSIVNKTLTTEEVQQQFPDVMQALPEKPRSFILRFDKKAAKLTAESLAVIRENQQEIAKRAEPEITVIGHTDREGTDENNLRLSLNRAEAVRDILVAGGVPAQIIQAVGRGELEPLVATEDGVAEPLNRRVEVTVR